MTIDHSHGIPVVTIPSFQYPLNEERTAQPLNTVEPGMERSLRLTLRLLLAQAGGEVRDETVAIADDIALTLMQNFTITQKAAR